MEATNPKLSRVSTIDHKAIKHLEFSIFISSFLQASRFSRINDNSLIEAFSNLSTTWDLRQNFQDLLNESKRLSPAQLIQYLAQHLEFQNFFTNTLKLPTLPRAVSTINKISKALNVAIRVFEGTVLKEYYAGDKTIPIAISIVLQGNKFLPVVHRLEQNFDNGTSPELLQDAPFVRQCNMSSDIKLLQEFKGAVLSISQFLKQEHIRSLKSTMGAINNKHEQELKISKFINDEASYGKCSHHPKHICFPCKTLHCTECFLKSRQDSCSCKVKVSLLFINEKIHGLPPGQAEIGNQPKGGSMNIYPGSGPGNQNRGIPININPGPNGERTSAQIPLIPPHNYQTAFVEPIRQGNLHFPGLNNVDIQGILHGIRVSPQKQIVNPHQINPNPEVLSNPQVVYQNPRYQCTACLNYETDVTYCNTNNTHILCRNCMQANNGNCTVCNPYKCMKCSKSGANLITCPANSSHKFCRDCMHANNGICCICNPYKCSICLTSGVMTTCPTNSSHNFCRECVQANNRICAICNPYKCIACSTSGPMMTTCPTNNSHTFCSNCVQANNGICPVCNPYKCSTCRTPGSNLTLCPTNNAHMFCSNCVKANNENCPICNPFKCSACNVPGSNFTNCPTNSIHMFCSNCVKVNNGNCCICNPYQCYTCLSYGPSMASCPTNAAHTFCENCVQITRGVCPGCNNHVCYCCHHYILYDYLVAYNEQCFMHMTCYEAFIQNNP